MNNKKPNVFMTGFPRCASTYTLNVLNQHPNVSVSNPKEPNYFNWKFFFFGHPKFLSPYRKNTFKEYSNLLEAKKVRIDGSILASYDKKSAERIYNVLGDIKIIFLIRDKKSFKKSLYKIMVHNGDTPNIHYENFSKKYKKLVDYYGNFEKHIEIFKRRFSNVKVFNIVDNDSKKEIKKIAKHLELPNYKYNFDIDRNSDKKQKPAKLKHRIKRKLLVIFPFLANTKWKK